MNLKRKSELTLLREEVAALRKELADLKALPRETHNHFHTHYDQTPVPPSWQRQPYTVPYVVPYWHTGTGISVADATTKHTGAGVLDAKPS